MVYVVQRKSRSVELCVAGFLGSSWIVVTYIRTWSFGVTGAYDWWTLSNSQAEKNASVHVSNAWASYRTIFRLMLTLGRKGDMPGLCAVPLPKIPQAPTSQFSRSDQDRDSDSQCPSNPPGCLLPCRSRRQRLYQGPPPHSVSSALTASTWFDQGWKPLLPSGPGDTYPSSVEKRSTWVDPRQGFSDLDHSTFRTPASALLSLRPLDMKNRSSPLWRPKSRRLQARGYTALLHSVPSRSKPSFSENSERNWLIWCSCGRCEPWNGRERGTRSSVPSDSVEPTLKRGGLRC